MSDMSAIPFRVQELERDLDEERKFVADLSARVTRHDEQISGAGGLVKAMEALSSKVDSLNKALYTFAASFIVAAVTIAIAVSGIK